MSWFSSFDTGEALSKLSKISTKVQASVTELSTLVPEIPDNDQTKFLRSLTLNSPDMVAERSQLDLEERRKELARDHLSELLPWETNNEELGIFVEDCREGILALSSERSTFLLPFSPPEGMHLFPTEDGGGGGGANEDTGDAENSGGEEVDEVVREKIKQKLIKLQPLPVLLEDFDIEAHVGLIERLLGEDTILETMHSSLTGAGDKERLFWQNYFFHCAYTRYEKGLTIEEIWERKPAPPTTQQMAADADAAAAANTKANTTDTDSSTSNGIDDSESVELTFDLDDDGSSHNTGGDCSSLDASSLSPTPTAVGIAKSSTPGLPNLSSAAPPTGGGAASASMDYEIIDVSGNDDDSGESEDEDAELDDLEAEIARELEED
mmetsp:Transcript_8732/g.10188  ORF Transcript_8732/g.10188 Transcript_8732/m.10188 type:complete len:381 (+) Transcript_8732:217-1359(+)|eukprot:CAMPEP_0198261700 /NCGR_PEP_ID=MMETSP1447-20131203/10382_1 /TAXON_ID=420782 /ORGANISM="Chaetoceros dichaeta, Strain CCMP1751" /LENGTH=380 /DNA_ID=CAMNT_0043949709 /DNA_START=193 /DNA_END=1335 /DNA_ORIENTATION=+